MGNEENNKYIGLVPVISFLTMFLLSKAEGYKYSDIFLTTVTIVIGTTFAIIMIKNRKKGLGVKFNISFAILGIITFALFAITSYLYRDDFQVPYKYKTLTNIVSIASIGCYFVFMITLIVGCSIYIEKMNKR